MANTFQTSKELQADFVECKAQYTCSFMSKHIQRIHCYSSEFAFYKIVRAEIEVRKYVLGQQRKSPSNKHDTSGKSKLPEPFYNFTELATVLNLKLTSLFFLNENEI